MEDNLTQELDQESLDIIKKYKENGKIKSGFLPFITYDMVQSGYPRPDHGIMIARDWGGTDENDNLIHGNGMWCKVEDVVTLLKD